MKPLATYILTLITVVAVTAAIVALHRPAPVEHDETVPLEQAREAFPEAAEVVPPEEETQFSWVLDDDGEHLGSVVSSTPHSDHIRGYAGPTPVLVAVDPDGVIIEVVLLDNVETPSYVRRLVESRFFERWEGMSWREAAGETKDVDAVSSVTITADSVTRTLRHRLSLIDPDAPVAPPKPSLRIDLSDVGVALVVILGIVVGLYFGRLPRWVRTAQLALSVLVLGVLLASMFSMGLIAGWLKSGAVVGSPGPVVLVGVALLVPIVFRKNLYCHFVCPFGGLQELLFKLVPFRIKVPRAAHKHLRLVRYGLLLVIAVSLLFELGLDPNDLEPFPAFRPGAAGASAIAIALASLLLAPVFARPWCNYACPSGALLDTLKRPRAARKTRHANEERTAEASNQGDRQ